MQQHLLHRQQYTQRQVPIHQNVGVHHAPNPFLTLLRGMVQVDLVVFHA